VTPYYQDDLVTIYHGDCREIVPQLDRFDLLLTDPPYGIGRDGQTPTTGGHGGRKGYQRHGWDDERPDPETLALVRGAADEAIIWGGNYFADLLPPTSRWLVWDKGQRINQSDGELAWTSQDAALRILTINRSELIRDHAIHPTQKPVALMRWCLTFAPKARTVLDPFMGSGSTLRAGKSMGKRVVGIERVERYCEKAALYCSQGTLGLDAA
jgi:DNA modification methylase